MGDVVLTGLSASDPEPGVYIETNFAAGASSGFQGERPALLLGNKSSAGSATVDTVLYGPDTPVPCGSEAEVLALFGTGSPLHRAYRRFVRINPLTSVYLLAVTASTGAAATLTITFTNPATGNGNVRTYFDEEFVDTTITSGDTPTDIAAAHSARVNEKRHWPFTAAPSAGTVVLTMRVPGPRGNLGRILNQISSGIGTTVSQTTDTAFAGGATADSNTAALATISTKRFYYIISEAEDATQLGALVTQVNLQALPTSKIRQRVFAGSVDTLANATTIATGRNTARAEIAWSSKSNWSPFELAAHNAAIFSLFERGTSPRCNFAGFPSLTGDEAFWSIPAPRDATAHPTRAQRVSALNNGLSPIGVKTNGTTYLVNRVTTKCQTGGTADYRIRDPHKVTITDMFCDAVEAKTIQNFSGKKIADDPPKGGRQPGPTVVTPQRFKATVINSTIDDFDSEDLLQDVPLIKAESKVARQVANRQRMGAIVQLRPIDIALQFAIQVNQVA